MKMNILKENIFTAITLLLLSFSLQSQTLLLQESFDGTNNFEANEFGNKSKLAGCYFTSGNYTTQPATMDWSNYDGEKLWIGENTDGGEENTNINPLGFGESGYVVINKVNVSAYSTVRLEILLGACTDLSHEAADYLKVQYAFDENIAPSGAGNVNKGTYTDLACFRGDHPMYCSNLKLDTDNNGLGDGIALLNELKNFTYDIPVTGTEISIRIEMCLDQGSEEAAFDNVRIYGVGVSNSDPSFTSTAITAATEDDVYTYNITATDDNAGDILTITAPTLPTWLSLTDNGDGTALLTGTPLNENIGTNAVELVVDDGVSKATDTQSFNIEVTNVNDAPSFTSTAVTAGTEDEIYIYNIIATDEDAGSVLTITASTLPTWLSLIDNGDGTALLTGTPSNTDIGTNAVELVVDDGVSKATDIQSFNIEVGNGTPMNPPGNALEFDGVNDFVNCGKDASFQISGEHITLEAWINPSSFASGSYQNSIIDFHSDSRNSKHGFALRCGGNGVLSFNLGSGSYWYEVLSPANSLLLGKWQHVVGTYDGATQKLYVDGKLVAEESFSISMSPNNTGTNLYIGESNAYSGRYFSGKIDEVRIWDDTRTESEIRDNMQNVLQGDEANLVAYYKFDYTSGNVLNDISTNSNNGTLGNMTDDDWISSEAMIYAPIATSATDANINSFTANWEENYTATKYYLDVASDNEFNSMIAGYDNLEVTGAISKAVSGLSIGTYYYRVRAYNGNTSQVSDNSNVITVSIQNTVPTFTSTPDTTAIEDQVYTYNITATDPDNGVLSISATKIPTWLALTDNGDGTAVITGTPLNENVGIDTVIIVVNDGRKNLKRSKASDSQTFNISVSNVNDAPQIVSFVPTETEVTLTSTSTLSFSITVEDVDSDTLSYSWFIDDEVQVDSILATFTHSFVNSVNPYIVKAVVSDGEFSDTTAWSVIANSGIEDNLPLVTNLSQNYPNPFNPVTTINYSLIKDDDVQIVVYNSVGKRIAVLVDSEKKAGYHSVQWNGANLTSGIYFIRMATGNYSKNIKAILVK